MVGYTFQRARFTFWIRQQRHAWRMKTEEVANGETLGVERQNNQLQPVLYPKVVRILRVLENVP